jgi:hypothetical protein
MTQYYIVELSFFYFDYFFFLISVLVDFFFFVHLKRKYVSAHISAPPRSTVYDNHRVATICDVCPIKVFISAQFFRFRIYLFFFSF